MTAQVIHNLHVDILLKREMESGEKREERERLENKLCFGSLLTHFVSSLSALSDIMILQLAVEIARNRTTGSTCLSLSTC